VSCSADPSLTEYVVRLPFPRRLARRRLRRPGPGHSHRYCFRQCAGGRAANAEPGAAPRRQGERSAARSARNRPERDRPAHAAPPAKSPARSRADRPSSSAPATTPTPWTRRKRRCGSPAPRFSAAWSCPRRPGAGERRRRWTPTSGVWRRSWPPPDAGREPPARTPPPPPRALEAYRRDGLLDGDVPGGAEDAAGAPPLSLVVFVGGARLPLGGGDDAAAAAAGAGDEGPLTDVLTLARRRDVALARHWQAMGITVVGVEPLDVDVSFVRVYQGGGLATVDNIERAAGQMALPFALRGEKAAYGMKPTAERVLPASLERRRRRRLRDAARRRTRRLRVRGHPGLQRGRSDRGDGRRRARAPGRARGAGRGRRFGRCHGGGGRARRRRAGPSPPPQHGQGRRDANRGGRRGGRVAAVPGRGSRGDGGGSRRAARPVDAGRGRHDDRDVPGDPRPGRGPRAGGAAGALGHPSGHRPDAGRAALGPAGAVAGRVRRRASPRPRVRRRNGDDDRRAPRRFPRGRGSHGDGPPGHRPRLGRAAAPGAATARRRARPVAPSAARQQRRRRGGSGEGS
jgi:hypothetical protein